MEVDKTKRDFIHRMFGKKLEIFTGASPMPPASGRRAWKIDLANWKKMSRTLCLGGSFSEEKVIRNRSWEGVWEVWGGSWEVFRSLLVLGWCLGCSGGGLWIDIRRLLDGFRGQNGVKFDPKSKKKQSYNMI